MATRRSSRQTGNGDVCPVDREHGAMLVLSSGTQYCPNQRHDGVPKTARGGPQGPTPKFWPGGWKSFEEAVIRYNEGTTKAAAEPSALPELTITLEV